MKITAISDLHGYFPKLEGGDLLIIAGDLTAKGTEPEYFDCFDWIHEQPYRKKILIAGNHDMQMQEEDYRGPVGVMKESFEYLCDSGTEFQGFKVWGSPWILWFEGINPHCAAFTLKTDTDLMEKWNLIPKDTDILVTHSPPHTILDGTDIITKWGNIGKRYGSESLFNLFYGEIVRPKLHVFGHIHEGYGIEKKITDCPHTIFINASHVDIKYRPYNKPVTLEL